MNFPEGGMGVEQRPQVNFSDDALEVTADLLADELGLDAANIHDLIMRRKLTCLLERGEGEDEGTYRLTFFTSNCRLRMVVNYAGKLIRRSRIHFGSRPLPPTLKRR